MSVQSRVKRPALVPGATRGIENFYCLYAAIEGAYRTGETDERLAALLAWREGPTVTDAEPAAPDAPATPAA